MIVAVGSIVALVAAAIVSVRVFGRRFRRRRAAIVTLTAAIWNISRLESMAQSRPGRYAGSAMPIPDRTNVLVLDTYRAVRANRRRAAANAFRRYEHAPRSPA